MKKEFEKKLGLLELIKYWGRSLKWIAGICILVFIIVAGESYLRNRTNTSNQSDMLAEESGYVCSTMISIIPKTPTDGSQNVAMDTYLAVMISNTVIQDVIDELGLSDSFIDLFHKMTWEIRGNTLKLTITSPVNEIDGYTWDAVLSKIVDVGKKQIENTYNISSFTYIDKPYYENVSQQAAETTTNTVPTISYGSIIKKSILVSAVVFILLSAVAMLKYLLDLKISCKEDIENNLDIPVLVEIEK